MNFSKVEQTFFPLQGGLDLTTPAISLPPGKVLDSMNYEPYISGGYRRVDGFERYDGHPSPSQASYWLMIANLTGTVNVGDTLTGATSGATGVVLGIFYTTNVILANVSGTFAAGENLLDSAVNVGSVTTGTQYGQNAALIPADDASYMLLAANQARTLISAVPGSGWVQGVKQYNGTIYAFRDNVGATANLMYKATSTGWQQITFGSEILFGSATSQISNGNTITGATSGATATVAVALLRTGTWTSSGAGSLVVTGVTGTFQNGEILKVGATSCVTTTSLCNAITRSALGNITMEFDVGNFNGSTNNTKMYGVDGINTCFEFDGTNYVPIHTGMTTDTPTHVRVYKYYLWLSFLGSIQFSALGNPYAWTIVLGAGEIDVGDPVTGFIPQGGNINGPALAIFTKGNNGGHTWMLYGSTSANFLLIPSIPELGFSPLTMQQVSNTSYGITARGVQALISTQTFGDFDYASISHPIQPLMNQKRGLEVCSTALKGKNQYRIYFSDGTALAVGLTGDQVNGIMLLNYGVTVNCIDTTTLASEAEVTYFGATNGYVYQDNVGNSFDGSTIPAWIRLPFNHIESPRVRKRFRRAVLELTVNGYTDLSIGYDIGYGTPKTLAPANPPDAVMVGTGGYWDSFTWEQFVWDTQMVLDPSIPLQGTEKNISFLFYQNNNTNPPHILQGLTIIYSPGRTER